MEQQILIEDNDRSQRNIFQYVWRGALLCSLILILDILWLARWDSFVSRYGRPEQGITGLMILLNVGFSIFFYLKIYRSERISTWADLVNKSPYGSFLTVFLLVSAICCMSLTYSSFQALSYNAAVRLGGPDSIIPLTIMSSIIQSFLFVYSIGSSDRFNYYLNYCIFLIYLLSTLILQMWIEYQLQRYYVTTPDIGNDIFILFTLTSICSLSFIVTQILNKWHKQIGPFSFLFQLALFILIPIITMLQCLRLNSVLYPSI